MSKLERVAYISIIGLCLLTAGFQIEHRFAPTPVAASHLSAKTLVGKRLAISGIDWQSAPLTAVLFINSHCHFCEASTPFYKEVADLHSKHRNGLKVAALSIERESVTTDFLKQKQVSVDAVYQLKDHVEGLTGTPTLLILDSNGVVQRVYTGVLDVDRQQEFFGIVERASL